MEIQIKATFEDKTKSLKASDILNYNSLVQHLLRAFPGLPTHFVLNYRFLPEEGSD